jgi:hypothetical protein
LNVGRLFGDLIASVERAEKAVSKSSQVPSEQDLSSKDFASTEMLLAEQSHSGPPPAQSKPMNFEVKANPPQNLEPEQLPQSLSLSPADWNLALLFIVHAQLVRALEPGHNFANTVNVHQVGTVRPPEQTGVKARQ